jgi:probable F420-dependent oxidoreductase
MNFGIVVWNNCEPASVNTFKEVATTAEELEYDGLWCGDHITFPDNIPDIYPGSPSGESPFDISQKSYDTFETLSYLSAITDDIHVGTNVCIVPYRHPVVLAKNALTLESLSEGRFEFGVGAGWLRTEFEVLDVPFNERGSRTDEFLEIFDRACKEGEFEFDGPHHSFQKTGFYPVPDRDSGPPIWVGGHSGASFRRVAEYGNGWTAMWSRPDEIVDARKRIMRAWNDYGRSSQPNIAVMRPVHVGTDTPQSTDRPLIGDPNKIIEDIESYADAGTTQIIINFFSRNADSQIEQIERFGSEVIPSFK